MDPRVKPAGDGTAAAVIAGLDPAIHPLRKKFLRRRWTRGSSPRVTGDGVVVKPGGDAYGAPVPAPPLTGSERNPGSRVVRGEDQRGRDPC